MSKHHAVCATTLLLHKTDFCSASAVNSEPEGIRGMCYHEDVDVFPVQVLPELVGHWSGKIPPEAWHELTGEQRRLCALASDYGVSYESVRRTKKAAKRVEVV